MFSSISLKRTTWNLYHKNSKIFVKLIVYIFSYFFHCRLTGTGRTDLMRRVSRASRRTTIPTGSRRSSDVHLEINWYVNNLLLESKLSGLSSIISYEYWQITFCKNPRLLPNLYIIKSIQQYLSLINKMDSKVSLGIPYGFLGIP